MAFVVVIAPIMVTAIEMTRMMQMMTMLSSRYLVPQAFTHSWRVNESDIRKETRHGHWHLYCFDEFRSKLRAKPVHGTICDLKLAAEGNTSAGDVISELTPPTISTLTGPSMSIPSTRVSI
mmetsp:Transcript_21531/g.41796  ORF Transcript_21531/g.41796 Transcript_21531/m.41796 type:complete len:121 (+) Transcript_21531:1170-1532(+)